MVSAIVFGDEAEVEAALKELDSTNNNSSNSNNNNISNSKSTGSFHGRTARIEVVNEPGNIVVAAESEQDLRKALGWLATKGIHSLAFTISPVKRSKLTMLLLVLAVVALGGSSVYFFAAPSDAYSNSQSWYNPAFSVPIILCVLWISVAAVGFIKLFLYSVDKTLRGGSLPPSSYHAVNPLKQHEN